MRKNIKLRHKDRCVKLKYNKILSYKSTGNVQKEQSSVFAMINIKWHAYRLSIIISKL